MADYHAREIAALVSELLDEVPVRVEWVEYRPTRSGGKHAERRAATRRDAGLLWQLSSTTERAVYAWERHDILKKEGDRDVRAGHYTTPAKIGAALAATLGAMVPSGSPGWDADGALSPTGTGGSFESSAPATPALELADQIASEVAVLYAGVCAADGIPGTRHTVGGRLRELVSRALETDDYTADWALAKTRTWVASCRTLLGYDARIIELARWHCPDCGGRLRTRADDESTVRCAGLGVVEGPPQSDEHPFPVAYGPCGAWWGKGEWVDLMARQQARTTP